MISVNYHPSHFKVYDLFLYFELLQFCFLHASYFIISLINLLIKKSQMLKYLLSFHCNIHLKKSWLATYIFYKNFVSSNCLEDVKIYLIFFDHFLMVNYHSDKNQKTDLKKKTPKLYLIMYSLKFCIFTLHLL